VAKGDGVSGNEKDDEITVPCPRCGGSHTYPFKVERSIMLYELIADQMPPDEERSFRRVFVCPTTDKTFQGRVVLMESFFEKITGLTVGPAKAV
jgi:hypothetical protein